jgi:exodeoxyribonuclease V alpha subunit
VKKTACRLSRKRPVKNRLGKNSNLYKGDGRMASISLPLYDEHHPYIKGRLVREIFHNPENMYTVSIVKVTEATELVQEDKVTVVGNYPPLLEGEVYTFWGNIKEHPRFGKQYLLEHYRKEVPHGKDGVTQYLSSDLFPGVGKKTAQKIVETLGENAIQLMLENPDCLDEVPQLPHKVKHILNEKLLEYQGLEQVMVKLSEYGIGLALSTQIYQKYEHAAMEVLRRNPYQLIEDVEGIGFKRADAIAAAMGIRFDAPERIQAACIYFLWEQAEQNGHVYVPLEEFLINTKKWLNDTGERMPSVADDGDDRDEGEAERPRQRIDELLISDQVIEMGKAGKIMIEDERVYLPSLFYAEKGFAKKVKELCEAEVDLAVSQQEMYAAIGEIEEQLGIEYAPTQREAIERALQSSLLILTGGPGTGRGPPGRRRRPRHRPRRHGRPRLRPRRLAHLAAGGGRDHPPVLPPGNIQHLRVLGMAVRPHRAPAG